MEKLNKRKVEIIMVDAAWHALVIVSFLLVGVPSNVAVLWIHTRKNSRVAKNRFPLIFAAIDLFTLVTSLPLLHNALESGEKPVSNSIYYNVSSTFAVNGYLVTLFMATVDKFYAVMFPFKYGKKREQIFKAAVIFTIVPNAMLAIAIAAGYRIIGTIRFFFIIAFYNVSFALTFLIILIFYIFIIAKLIRNQRNLRKVNING